MYMLKAIEHVRHCAHDAAMILFGILPNMRYILLETGCVEDAHGRGAYLSSNGFPKAFRRKRKHACRNQGRIRPDTQLDTTWHLPPIHTRRGLENVNIFA
jgi:hypothetical protein